MIRFALFLVLLNLPHAPFAQNTSFRYGSPSLELNSSHLFTSSRLASDNGDQHLYYEARLGVPIGKYFELKGGASYQLRSFIYYAKGTTGNLVPLYMERHYNPLNLAGRIYLTEFFLNSLKLWKTPGRWDIYFQLGISVLKGKDVFDEQEDVYRSQGYFTPYFQEPYIQEYGKVYTTHLIGLRYNFGKHVGVFLEGGEGPLTTMQVGLSLRK